ncbi:PREDICTED: uncharacterized protein LOC107183925 [Myotis davidii]|uniref:uncharacterized protein LOC107183925 n=1 Tax=Myotis davidii TaxID=225400 RepID=UPI000766E32F|nr:PREDICTED: uncharacterized protein LOC107183925 [Myotis davidii]
MRDRPREDHTAGGPLPSVPACGGAGGRGRGPEGLGYLRQQGQPSSGPLHFVLQLGCSIECLHPRGGEIETSCRRLDSPRAARPPATPAQVLAPSWGNLAERGHSAAGWTRRPPLPLLVPTFPWGHLGTTGFLSGKPAHPAFPPGPRCLCPDVVVTGARAPGSCQTPSRVGSLASGSTPCCVTSSLDIVSWGEAHLLSGDPGSDLPLLDTQAHAALLRPRSLGSGSGCGTPLSPRGHSPPPTWGGSCAFKAFPHRPAGREGGAAQLGSGTQSCAGQQEALPARQVSWDGGGSGIPTLGLSPQSTSPPGELLDVMVGETLGLGASQNVWGPGVQPQLCPPSCSRVKGVWAEEAGRGGMGSGGDPQASPCSLAGEARVS